MRTSLLLALVGLTLFPVTAAAELRACESGQEFQLREVWPAADATDIPTDGIVVITGQSPDGSDAPYVEVVVDDITRDGEIESVGGGVYIWRGAPFAPDTTYTIVQPREQPAVQTSFTTGADKAAPPAAPGPADLALAQKDIDVVTCLEGVGVCCTESSTETRTRMQATLTLPDPPAPFTTVNRAVVQLAPDEASFGDAFTSDQPWQPSVVLDLGEPGTWPSDQVCARVSVIDPLARRADGEVVCQPIGAVNTDQGGGCSLTGERTSPWLLLLLPLLARRRARA